MTDYGMNDIINIFRCGISLCCHVCILLFLRTVAQKSGSGGIQTKRKEMLKCYSYLY